MDAVMVKGAAPPGLNFREGTSLPGRRTSGAQLPYGKRFFTLNPDNLSLTPTTLLLHKIPSSFLRSSHPSTHESRKNPPLRPSRYPTQRYKAFIFEPFCNLSQVKSFFIKFDHEIPFPGNYLTHCLAVRRVL